MSQGLAPVPEKDSFFIIKQESCRELEILKNAVITDGWLHFPVLWRKADEEIFALRMGHSSKIWREKARMYSAEVGVFHVMCCSTKRRMASGYSGTRLELL